MSNSDPRQTVHSTAESSIRHYSLGSSLLCSNGVGVGRLAFFCAVSFCLGISVLNYHGHKAHDRSLFYTKEFHEEPTVH